MSERYELIGHDGVIILNSLAAYKPVFDASTQQTMSTNEHHQFSKIRTYLGLFMKKMILTLFIIDFCLEKVVYTEGFYFFSWSFQRVMRVTFIAYLECSDRWLTVDTSQNNKMILG